MLKETRKRQIEKKKRTAEHDAQYTSNELAKAAACYALGEKEVFVLKADKGCLPQVFDPWPWHTKHHRYPDSLPLMIPNCDKRSKYDRIKKLAMAGALIAAELDRIMKDAETPKK